MKNKQIFFTSLSTILFLFLFVSCTMDKEEQLRIVNHVIKSDTIFEEKSFFNGFSNNCLIDMKYFNDSVFLYTIVFQDNNCYLKTYSIHDSIKLVEEKKLPTEISKTIIEEKCSNIHIINSDSLILSTKIAFYFYSISNQTVYKTIVSDEGSYFSYINSNFYYDQLNEDIYSYYIDGKDNYMDDLKNEKKVVFYARTNVNNNYIEKIKAKMDDTLSFYNTNLQFHFAYANGLFIYKSSYNNGFETYNPITKEYDYIEFSFLKKTIDNTNYQQNNKLNYQNLKKHYMDSYIQQSLMYDYQTQKIVLLYLKPVPERDENGLMPEFCFRKKNFYLFNNDFTPIGLIETKEDCFLPSYSFAINGKIHLLRISQNEITLNTIEYELP